VRSVRGSRGFKLVWCEKAKNPLFFVSLASLSAKAILNTLDKSSTLPPSVTIASLLHDGYNNIDKGNDIYCSCVCVACQQESKRQSSSFVFNFYVIGPTTYRRLVYLKANNVLEHRILSNFIGQDSWPN
jgi:hypothetical protein